jgi:hypothetical protein
MEASHGPAVISPTPPKDIHGRVFAAPMSRETLQRACISASCFHRAWGAFCLAGDNARPRGRSSVGRRVAVLRHSVYTRRLHEVNQQSLEKLRRARRENDKSKPPKRMRLQKNPVRPSARAKANFD